VEWGGGGGGCYDGLRERGGGGGSLSTQCWLRRRYMRLFLRDGGGAWARGYGGQQGLNRLDNGLDFLGHGCEIDTCMG
jgi:hypothetical protein